MRWLHAMLVANQFDQPIGEWLRMGMEFKADVVRSDRLRFGAQSLVARANDKFLGAIVAAARRP
jgi:hypothetical protein